ncbi:MAG TPA: TonB-dependent receptor [Thermoanaerobaculia bacterium]|jgi:iron complex outermembrane receptor protein|nr:TonB-dependent receptor [Thermoanaerobaculia bacterium]
MEQLSQAFLIIACSTIAAIPLRAQSPSVPSASEQIVVSATKLPEDKIDLPADVTVITGEELRARGVQTLGDALATTEGVEAFDGSDQGGRIPNVSLWGLKEFDAYLVELDGVPVGGNYDPDLQQIDVRNIDRIEVIRGPAGAVHGSTAFAGVIAIYSSDATSTRAELSGGSFGQRTARFSTGASNADTRWTINASANQIGGWRPRTSGSRDDLSATWGIANLAGGSLKTRIFALDQREDYGSPLPVDSDLGTLPDGVDFHSNLALRGSEIASRDIGFTTRYDHPLSSSLTLTNDFGYTHRNRHLARTFVDAADGDSLSGAGTDFRPRHNDVFEDLRLQWLPAEHRLVVGTSIAYGSLNSNGRRFDLSYDLGGPVPAIKDFPDGTGIRLTDRRTFAGIYAEDEWTPTRRITATGGLRYDRDNERRSFDDTDGNSSRESRHDGALSGRGAVVIRLIEQPSNSIQDANVHVAVNRTFKPAAFDPTPQEDEGLLAPERSHSVEAGFKIAGAKRLWDLDLTAFDMHIVNIVVSADVNGNPTLINGGEDHFRGAELAAQLHPSEQFTIRAGYAQHDPRLQRLVFSPAPGQVEDDSGHLAELVARHTENLALIYSPRSGPGGSVTIQAVGPRKLDRDNVFTTKPYTMVNASFFIPFSQARFEVVGKNLLNKRYYTTDSELADGLRYISAPRSFLGRVTWTF